MSLKLEPYPKYKDSGLPWLGNVPEHWETLPNRALFKELNERNYPGEPLLSVTIRRGVIRQSDLLASTTKKDSSNENKANYKLVRPNDIAYNKMRAWQGALGVAKHRGIVSPAYIVVRLRGSHNPEYFHYLMRTPAFAKEAGRWSYGITSDQWSLRPGDFKQIYCCIPAPKEQDAIVLFLKRVEQLISRLVSTKRRLIELLNEQKQVIINRLVTRGLDPHVRLKPSGIDSIGYLPLHYEVLPLKRCIRNGTSISYGIVQPGPHLHDGIPFLQTSDITHGCVKPSSLQRTSPAIAASYPRSRLEAGDVVLGIRASIGASVVVGGDLAGANLSRGIARIVPSARLRNDYLVAYLRSRPVKSYWELARQGTTFHEVTIETVRALPVVLPPIDEQFRIVQNLQGMCRPLDEAIMHGESSIRFLREYRTRLIADVVTGKLDVCNIDLPAFEGAPEVGDLAFVDETEGNEIDDIEEIADDDK